jgi:transposase
MISFPHPVRVFLHTPATDLRKGFDALSGLVTTAFSQDPTSGHLFLFVNRRRDRLKILYWDRGDGLAIWYKRLEKGSFQLPVVVPDAVSFEMRFIRNQRAPL